MISGVGGEVTKNQPGAVWTLGRETSNLLCMAVSVGPNGVDLSISSA